MYCNIPQVNQLTALLLSHGIHDIVVCPGSRNATIVHNLHEYGHRFHLHPVTDERSAAFVALGMSLAQQEPTAVCVTSGSALLGCIPAVAEAYYRHIPLLVISADRPAHWIGQYDGQTLPQDGALTPYCRSYQLCTPHTEEDYWYNNRTINEAILSLHSYEGGPAHINVPIEEPMFTFTTPKLPKERVIQVCSPHISNPVPPEVLQRISEARLPALVIGHYERGDIRKEVEDLVRNHQLFVLPEIISDVPGNHRMNIFDRLETCYSELIPDLIIHIGGNFVHKRFKQLLRQSSCSVIRIGIDRELPDTFCHLDTLIPVPVQSALEQLSRELPHENTWVKQAQEIFETIVAEERVETPDERLSIPFTLHSLKDLLDRKDISYALHLGNSSSVRAAGEIFYSGKFPIYCNRGVNGIEGSLSTAVGYATKMWGLSIAILGDLSFFYDANALWNTRLPVDLRILLLNNGHGGIFDKIPGLADSPARDKYIAAGHQHFSAAGIATTFDLGYHAVHDVRELPSAMENWISESDTAQILEVFINDYT